MAQKEGINTPLVVTLTVISATFLIVIMFGVEAWFNYQVQMTRDEMFAEMGDTPGLGHQNPPGEEPEGNPDRR